MNCAKRNFDADSDKSVEKGYTGTQQLSACSQAFLAWTDITWHFRLATILISQMQLDKKVQAVNVIFICFMWLRQKI